MKKELRHYKTAFSRAIEDIALAESNLNSLGKLPRFMIPGFAGAIVAPDDTRLRAIDDLQRAARSLITSLKLIEAELDRSGAIPEATRGAIIAVNGNASRSIDELMRRLDEELAARGLKIVREGK